MQKTILTILAVVAFTASPVLAHDVTVPVGDDTYYLTPHPGHAANDPVHHVEETQVWKESNGLAGLQKTDVTVDGVAYTPDTRVA